MTPDDDIRRLLGRAFGPEPPLVIDRDAVLRRGRRRVRARWYAASGAVALSVVAVVVGAVAVTGLTGAPRDVRPGSALETSTGYGVASVTPSGPPTEPSGPVVPARTSEQHAADLTVVLAKAQVLPSELKVVAVPLGSREPLAFQAYSGSYLTSADLTDAKGRGSMTVQITYLPGGHPRGCADLTAWAVDCAEVAESGIPMVVSTERQDAGYIAYVVRAVRSDGTSVYVNATNVSSLSSVAKATRGAPPLDPGVLRSIAALPGLTFF